MWSEADTQERFLVKVGHLTVRMLSVCVRVVAISIFFRIDASLARETLAIISAVYLFQVISGLELYLNTESSETQHFNNMVALAVVTSVILTGYFSRLDVSYLWSGYFFFDTLLVEMSRKKNIIGELRTANLIAVTRAMIFFVATLSVIVSEEFLLPILLSGTVMATMAYAVASSIVPTMPNFSRIRNLVAQVNIVAISLAVMNRSIDLAIRHANSHKTNPANEFWDFFLSVFGVLQLASFYLFIGQRANEILTGRARVSAVAMTAQFVLAPALIFVSALYFSWVTGQEFTALIDSTIISITAVAIIVSVVQLLTWEILWYTDGRQKGAGRSFTRILVVGSAFLAFGVAILKDINISFWFIIVLFLLILFFHVRNRVSVYQI